jgi:AbrB family looped-hinge helix DNA binding protein
MAKVTSKFQVTLPKAIAVQFNIQPGDDIDWVAAGDIIRVVPSTSRTVVEDLESRLRLFDQSTERLHRRSKHQNTVATKRGWTREDLYTRGRSR